MVVKYFLANVYIQDDIQVNMDSVNISTTKPEIFMNYSYKRDRSARMLLRQHKYKKGQRLSVYNNKSKRLIKRYE